MIPLPRISSYCQLCQFYIYIYTSIYPIVIIIIMYKLISTIYIYTYTQKNIYYIISHPYPINITLIRFSPCLTFPNILVPPEKRRPELSFKRSRGQRRSSLGRCHLWVKDGPRWSLGDAPWSVLSGVFGWCLGGALVYRLYGGANGGVGLSVMQQLTSDSAHGPQRGDPTFGRDPAWFLLHRSAQSDSKFSTPTDFNTRRAGTAQTAHGPARQTDTHTHSHTGNSCSKRS